MRAMRSIGGSSSRSPSADSDAAAAALRKRLHFARVGSFSFTIPAEVPRHEIESSLFVHRPMSLIAIHPHMHLLGREMKVWAKLPDESTRPLVHCDPVDGSHSGRPASTCESTKPEPRSTASAESRGWALRSPAMTSTPSRWATSWANNATRSGRSQRWEADAQAIPWSMFCVTTRTGCVFVPPLEHDASSGAIATMATTSRRVRTPRDTTGQPRRQRPCRSR